MRAKVTIHRVIAGAQHDFFVRHLDVNDQRHAPQTAVRAVIVATLSQMAERRDYPTANPRDLAERMMLGETPTLVRDNPAQTDIELELGEWQMRVEL